MLVHHEYMHTPVRVCERVSLICHVIRVLSAFAMFYTLILASITILIEMTRKDINDLDK